MQREEDSGYFKCGVLPISISVWFPLPKMRTPLLLVLFHKTLLAGRGKQWGLQPLHTAWPNSSKCLAGRVGCGLSPERDCFYYGGQLHWLHRLLPLQFAQAASSSSPSGVGNQNRLSAVLSAPILHLIQAFSCNHRAICLNLQGHKGDDRVT